MRIVNIPSFYRDCMVSQNHKKKSCYNTFKNLEDMNTYRLWLVVACPVLLTEEDDYDSRFCTKEY